jgi:hypothetical protein
MLYEDRHISRAMELAREMFLLADEGEAEACDDSCSVLYGIIRDCSYQIKARAEREAAIHRRNAIWSKEAERWKRKGTLV